MFLESDNLKGRRMIDGGRSKETLISIDYLKKWNLLHKTFTLETIYDYVECKYKNNGYSALYSCLSNQLEANLYKESRGLKEPSHECKSLRAYIVKKNGVSVLKKSCQRRIESTTPSQNEVKRKH